MSKKIFALSLYFFSILIAQENQDPYLWLEEIEGEKSVQWVKAKNKMTVETLEKHPDFQEIHKKILKILNSKDRIAYPSIRGEYMYNFWQDDKNERGLWRRILLNEYFEDSLEWETVLDLDDLSEKEEENWAFNDAIFLYPNFNLCLLELSHGGSDAVFIREFDLEKKIFVDNGFYLHEAKTMASWLDKNNLIVSTDFGEGTLTTSGYPRIVKIWKRGSSLNEAEILFEGDKNDVGTYGIVEYTPEREYLIVYRYITFFTSEIYVMDRGRLRKLEIPEDARFNGFFKNQMLVELKSDWKMNGKLYQQGSLICIDYDRFLKGDRNFDILFKPDERSSLISVSHNKNYILLNQLKNVQSSLIKYLI